MPGTRNTLIYLSSVIVVVITGLASRHFAADLPRWVNLYLGDCLWALMIFFMISLMFRSKETGWVATTALLFCYLIEFSQLYHAPWIDSIRSSRIGALVLGRGFLWSDLIAYSVGIATGSLLDKLFLKFRSNR